MYVFELPYKSDNACPSDLSLINKKTHTHCDIPPLKLLIKGVWENPKTIQTVAIALGCPPKLDGKTQLLKTPYTLVTEQEEIKLALTKKLSPYWVTYLELKGVMQAAEREKYYQQS